MKRWLLLQRWEKTLKVSKESQEDTTEGLYALKNDALIMGVPYSERLVPKEAATYFSPDL